MKQVAHVIQRKPKGASSYKIHRGCSCDEMDRAQGWTGLWKCKCVTKACCTCTTPPAPALRCFVINSQFYVVRASQWRKSSWSLSHPLQYRCSQARSMADANSCSSGVAPSGAVSAPGTQLAAQRLALVKDVMFNGIKGTSYTFC